MQVEFFHPAPVAPVRPYMIPGLDTSGRDPRGNTAFPGILPINLSPAEIRDLVAEVLG